jgi:hypothetical protein
VVARRENGVWVNDAGEIAQIVVGPDGGSSGGALRAVSVELTRPSNTDPYDAGDAVTNSTSASVALTLAGVVTANGGSGRIVGGTLKTDKKDFSGIRLRLHLFNAAPTAISNDNAQHRILYADKEEEVGFIDFPAMNIGTDTTNSTGAISQAGAVYVPFTCAADSKDLRGVFEVLDAATPASGQKVYATLWIEG